MGLEDRLDTPIGVLSGGQRQALTVLMATMVRPSLLLLDEHTAALDPRSAEQVIRLTRRAVTAGTHHLDGHPLPHGGGPAGRPRAGHAPGADRLRLAGDSPAASAGERRASTVRPARWADRLDESAAEMLRRAYV